MQPPTVVVFVEYLTLNTCPEPSMRTQPVFGHQIQGVLLYLRSTGEEPLPVPLRGERELVGHHRNVRTDARIGVAQPGAAEILVPINDDEVLDTDLEQLDGRADAAQPGADDRHFVIRFVGQSHGCLHGSFHGTFLPFLAGYLAERPGCPRIARDDPPNRTSGEYLID
ncbi:Uncharacterised protein [Mycobacteroides abscessus subsp. massiliense]|nr:Uncharacterised protein [Mycobacteroides abscessus subsp. massiliense]